MAATSEQGLTSVRMELLEGTEYTFDVLVWMIGAHRSWIAVVATTAVVWFPLSHSFLPAPIHAKAPFCDRLDAGNCNGRTLLSIVHLTQSDREQRATHTNEGIPRRSWLLVQGLRGLGVVGWWLGTEPSRADTPMALSLSDASAVSFRNKPVTTPELDQVRIALTGEEAELAALEITTPTNYTRLASGVLYREMRPGQGDAVVQANSRVGIELTARCKAFPTARDPSGVKYFATAMDTEFNEIAFTVGVGQMLGGLEEGMLGMKRGAVRRIQVPSSAVYAAKLLNQLPLPTTKEGKRRYEALFQSDATLLFEVLVTRLKNG
jgi:FKBP-type peptidyl-prolyl cis-trans isomerase